MIEKQKEIYSHYGLENQLGKLEEECLELALAVKRHLAEPDDPKLNFQVGEEMADVLNLIEQIIYSDVPYGKHLEKLKEYKVNRELDRIARRLK